MQRAPENSRYRAGQKELEPRPGVWKEKSEKERKRADRYDLGEVFLEIGLVITSITLLSWAPKVLARGN